MSSLRSVIRVSDISTKAIFKFMSVGFAISFATQIAMMIWTLVVLERKNFCIYVPFQTLNSAMCYSWAQVGFRCGYVRHDDDEPHSYRGLGIACE